MKKPRIFVGSSVEGLEIAYAIQENLEYTADVTIWDQGIFKLTSNALDDLITVLKNSDYGIFVFSPDDITKIRQENFKTTRDNVIFEFGLFIGYLGKDRVSYVLPRGMAKFHLPSDLAGINPGTFEPERLDKNLRAALGPYCNQVKEVLKEISMISLDGFHEESLEVKRLVIEKPKYWEFLLTLEVIKPKVESLKVKINELESDLHFSDPKLMKLTDFLDWMQEKSNYFLQLVDLFSRHYQSMKSAWGETGKPGNEVMIRKVVVKMVECCLKALDMDKEIKGLILPKEIEDLKDFSGGWSKSITGCLIEFYEKLIYYFTSDFNPEESALDFKLTMAPPEKMSEFSSRIEYHRLNLHNYELE